MTANFLDDVKSVRIFPDADNDYAFVGNVVRGKSALFRLVVRNGFAHFVWKVFARRKLLPGKFWVFAPLSTCKYLYLMLVRLVLSLPCMVRLKQSWLHQAH